ncbi:NADP-dependent malic enzyme [Methanohalophilus sp. RSK]|nr:NADP-dependent malic enzyme [Methanohalophilus sp. RSK]RNI13859.1 NADP-dependent malic enzyme [Methanohalophilus sp. RSK]
MKKLTVKSCMETDDSLGEESLQLHEKHHGVLEVASKVRLDNTRDLSIAYTPGVAEPCKRIAENNDDVYKYTLKENTVAIITDGSAILGLGNIGASAGLPVMEGKAIIFKELAGINAFPICLDTQDTEEIIKTVKNIAPVFGGINLEDISAPRCFEIEERLKKELPIPVTHDDQHGTAIVTIAGLLNSLKLTGKKINEIKIVISGAGAAGMAIARKLLHTGVRPENLLVCDRHGIISRKRTGGMNPEKEKIAEFSNPEEIKGSLADAVAESDVFIGVSVPEILTEDMVASMNNDAIVFAMANPIPEIMPLKAFEAGARIVATGRSDCSNQINNCLGFPGIFKGALDTRATQINLEMELAAANALAAIVEEDGIEEDYIIPNPLDSRVVPAVAKAVADAAIKSGVALKK